MYFFLFSGQQSYIIQRLCRGGGKLGDGLSSLRDGVLGELSRKKKADSSLNLAGGESSLLVVAGKLGGLKGDALEDIVNEGVEDADASLGDTSLRVDLLEDLVDVRRVRLNSLLVRLASLLWGLCCLLSRCLCHFISCY